jgi:Domain of unknown function (DUF4082)/Bacterial Ig-like domain/Bacterial Ig domain/Abnormal spindle-like microcephaly-assoc'd, ASPM-SPD-2-Hydin
MGVRGRRCEPTPKLASTEKVNGPSAKFRRWHTAANRKRLRTDSTSNVRIPLQVKISMRQLRNYGLWFALLYPLWLASPAFAQCSSPANAIVAENCLPGTPQNTWDVSGAGDASIQGFTTDISVNQGQTVSFKINTNATNYKLDIYRMGYYGGAGARLVTTVTPSAHLPQTQPACITDAATALMDCGNWAVSATWTVPSTATSGIYFAHVIRADTGGDSHIPFIVRNDSSTSALLFKTSDTTWQAYNDYGGANLYAGGPGPQNGAYKVSYNRPYHTRVYEFYSWIFNAEYPMVRFLEANGYDVTYTSSLDADRSGSLLLQHKTLLSVGHDEYWSGNERTNVEAARAAGVNLAFFSGNEVFWKVRWEPSIDGSSTPNRTMVCYKETHSNRVTDPSDPPIWTGTWRDARFSPPGDGGRPENALTGTIFMVNGPQSPPLSIQVPAADGKMRLWRNTSVATQAAGATATFPAGTLGYEWDEDLDNGFRPSGLFYLSTATYDTAGNLLLDNGSTYGAGTGTHHMTMYRASSGALVFGSGTVQWSWGLDANHDGTTTTANLSMQQATINLFADMGAQPTTLQSGLVAASKSSDTTPPNSTITSPVSGGTVQAGSQTTITGTATDTGGAVAGIEVSTDGGTTWHPATGRANWTYNWTPTGAAGTFTIQSRAVDDSGNIETPSGGVTLTLAARTCPCSIWNSPTPGTLDGGDATSVEVGVKFRADSNGFINGISFYKSAANTGTHFGHLWTDSGTLLATGTFSGESPSGWQKLTFSTPVAITANSGYVASYYAPQGHYSADDSYFASTGTDNAPLHALADGVDGGDGVYVYGGAGTFPSNSFHSTNYWVDVVFVTNSGPDTTPPAVAAVTPAAGATLVATTATVNAVFSEPVIPATISGTTFQLFGPSNTLIPASVTYTAGSQTATLTPTAALAFSTTYTGVVTGGSGGVKDLAGNAMTSNFTWSFTTAAIPPTPGQCPCTVWPSTTIPTVVDSKDTTAGEYGFRFRTDVAGTITSVRFYKSASNTGTHAAHLWSNTGTLLATATFSGEGSSGWQQVDFSTPVSVTANTTYVASYFAPNGHYSSNNNYFVNTFDSPPLHGLQDGLDGANGVYQYSATSVFPTSTFQSSNYWVDVVFVPTPSLNPPTVTSVSPASNSTGASLSSVVSAVFSEPVNSATVNPTTFLLVDSSNNTVPGTITYNGSTATYTPSAQLASFTTYTATIKGGASGVKDLSGNALAADFTWSFTTLADTTPPSVSTVSPTAGATGVSTISSVNIVFSEAINPGTVTATTVQLLAPGNSPVASTVTYSASSKTATLQPNLGLASTTTYTVMVNGVKDLAGNTMTANFTSTFTTGIAVPPPGNCPCSIWTTSATPATVDSGDFNAAELGFRFRSDVAGSITGMRFYKGAENVGPHSGHIWSNTGTLLGTVTFTSESGSGWQQVNFGTPVPVAANTTYVASYFAPNSHYSATNNFFVSTIDNPPLHALQDGLDGANGVFNYGTTSAFPTSTYSSTNYWVDVVYVPRGSTTPPTVTTVKPANNATGVSLSSVVTAIFSEPMTASTINATNFVVVNSANNPVAGTVTYDAPSGTATFTPTGVLTPANTYTATLKSGSTGITDFNGNPLAADFSWSFATSGVPNNSGPGGPILVISSATNPFSTYYGEILSAEGMNEYLISDISTVTATTLANYDVVILGDMALTSAQASMLSTWVNGGGQLIAMHPDKQLAGLLGLTATTSVLSNAYLLVQTATGPGVGIVGQTIQFHGPADRYTLNGASSLATLYSNSTTSTTSPAVTLVHAGSGQAAAFTFDLARSIIYTRQGNPAWSGQARDGQDGPIRSDDLYFGAASFDPEPDWVDLNKVAIPQADEQQRFLVNLILQMNAAKKPLPRFWYFPNGFLSAVVMTGDDHGSFYSGSATTDRFGELTAASPAGCSVADWQCVRGTSYMFPKIIADNPMTDAQAAAYVAQGFELSVHVDSDPTCSNWIPADLDNDYINVLSSFSTQFPSVPAPKTHRMHCIGWSDYDTQPQIELSHAIRLDTSYYYWPSTWVNNVPGMFTGSGMPMRFTDRNGNLIDVYQAPTPMTDESGQDYPDTIDAILDNATGATGYYGAFVAQVHNDQASYPGIGPDVISSAQAHGVPIISAQQLLTWLDGRNTSSFGSMSWAGTSLNFTITVGTGARNLQAMLPANSTSGVLGAITFNGSPITFTTQTIKGVKYAFFAASAGSYVAKYGAAGASPVVGLSPTSLTFASQVVGTTSAAKSITLSNSGTAALTITGISITGTNSSSFAQTNTCGTSVAAGANCTISVKFTPAAAGALSASVSIADNAAGSAQTAALTGTGAAAAPGATPAPTSLAFANQTLNTASTAKTVTLTNNGNSALTITGYSFTGTNPTDFAQTHTCGATLAVGANCTISVTFTPSAASARSASLSIADNAANSPQTVTLTGTGTNPAPAVSLAPTSLAFGNQTVNVASAAKTVTLTNTGTATLTITSYTFTGTNPTNFAQTHTCGATLAAGANCTISVTFTPSATGARSASLSIADNATGSPQTVALTGTGTNPTPVVSLAPTSLAFAAQALNVASAAKAVTLTNTGTATLNITGYSFTGTNPTDFAQTHTCGTTLAVGASCTINVTFTPSAAGARSASLAIADNATGSPQTVALTGTGNGPVATLAPTSLTFAAQRRNTTSAPKTVTLTNSGNATLTISAYAFTGTNPTNFAQTHTCGATLAAGASCSISVTFTPTTLLPSATLNITTNAAGSPQKVTLSGIGL